MIYFIFNYFRKGVFTMKRKKFLLFYIAFVSIVFICLFSNIAFAADPKLVSTLTGAFTKIKGYIVRIATSFVAVAIATGLLMRKFSLGDEKKIYRANNLIKGSITSYVLIVCIDLVLSFVDTVLA